ncbi:calcium-binding protein [Streptomyces sp. NPDC002814]
MRIYSAAVAVCGVIALSALAVPAAQADEQFGDTEITGVVVNDGKPVVVGTSARTVSVDVTATDPAGLEQINATLYHGSINAPDSRVRSTGGCVLTAADTTGTCTLTFTLTPGTAPATGSLAGAWNVQAFAIGADSDAVSRDTAGTFTMQRETRLTVDAGPEPVKWGKVLTVKGGVQQADWATGTLAAGAADQPVALQFRQKGCATYSTVKTVKTAADGTLSTTVRAYSDGDYRWSYAGTDTTAAGVSEGDFVDVR